MEEAKRKRLEAAGWRVGTAEEFLDDITSARPDVPRVHTTASGARYVRAIDVIRSKAGRKEIDAQLEVLRDGQKRQQ